MYLNFLGWRTKVWKQLTKYLFTEKKRNPLNKKDS